MNIAKDIETNVCVHTTDPPCDMAEIADTLRKDDVFCHCYHGRGNTILADDGKVKSSMFDAKKRGVIFDSCNGMGNFSINVCRSALEQNFYPDIISSRSEEHTSELQSRINLVCRLLLEKKKSGWRQIISLIT